MVWFMVWYGLRPFSSNGQRQTYRSITIIFILVFIFVPIVYFAFVTLACGDISRKMLLRPTVSKRLPPVALLLAYKIQSNCLACFPAFHIMVALFVSILTFIVLFLRASSRKNGTQCHTVVKNEDPRVRFDWV